MFGIIRNMRRSLRQNVRDKVTRMRQMRTPGRAARGVQTPVDRDLNFAHKFDATDEELAKVRDLNETDLYSDGSSKYSRMDTRRHDGGDTESLNYPHAPDLKGKGSRAA